MTSTLRPRKLQGDCITTREIEAEILIYDERTHRVCCLNPSSACIWQLCDGRNTVEDITAQAAERFGAALDEQLVLFALEELQEKGLLESGMVESISCGATRRKMIGRIGLAAAALLPLVAAITAPPAWAQSGSVSTGSQKRAKRAAQAP